jgi:hypothetical protein
MIATWSAVLSNTMVNELRYQWGLDHNFSEVSAAPPQVQLQSIFTYGPASSIPGYTKETRNQISDNFSFTKGAHSFKTGVDIHYIETLRKSGTPMAGRYVYSTTGTSATAGSPFTAVPGCPSSGRNLEFCYWLLDLYNVPTTGVGGTVDTTGRHWTTFSQIRDFRAPGNELGDLAGTDTPASSDYAFYFQDVWKARPDLTLNLGLRYDLQLAPQPTHPNTTTELLAYYTGQLNIDYGGIQPRIGMAWNATPKSVIRAGIGVFYAKTVLNTFSAAGRVSGLRESTFNCTPTNTSTVCAPLIFPDSLFSQQLLEPAAPIISGLSASEQPRQPNVIDPQVGALCAASPSCAYRGLDKHVLRPRSYQGEVAYERQLQLFGNLHLDPGSQAAFPL